MMLQTVLACAQHFQQRTFTDIGAHGARELRVADATITDGLRDFLEMLHALPAEALRYFHGLVEALDVYTSIHGSVPLNSISLDEKYVHELRQIRDICLDDGLHSIY